MKYSLFPAQAQRHNTTLVTSDATGGLTSEGELNLPADLV
jgi:hypothetical protein